MTDQSVVTLDTTVDLQPIPVVTESLTIILKPLIPAKDDIVAENGAKN